MITPFITSDVSLNPAASSFKVDKGLFVLPNGHCYQISQLKIQGKEIDLTKDSLTKDQVHAIQKFVDQFFVTLSLSQQASLNLKGKDLNSLILKTGSSQSSSVLAYHREKEEILQKTDSDLALIVKEFHDTFFPSSSFPLSSSSDSLIESENEELNPLLKEKGGFLEVKKEEGASIKQEYLLTDGGVAEQTVTRLDTVQDHLAFLENMLKHNQELLKYLKNPSLLNENVFDSFENASSEYIKKIEENISYYAEAVEVAKKQLTSEKWINSSYFRDLITKKGFEKAADLYVSAPVNMRYQELRMEGAKKRGFFRLGVISDMRNGWFSLTDLENIKKDPKALDEWIKNLTEKKEFLEKKRDRIKGLTCYIPFTIIQKQFTSSSLSISNQLQSVNYALNQLNLISNFSPDDVKDENEAIDSFIAERFRTLQLQMVQLINQQIQQNIEKFKNSSTFDLVHVALLNQQKKALDKTGWMHDEKVEMEDMQEIFQAFNGMKIKFVSEGSPLLTDVTDEKVLFLPLPQGLSEKDKEELLFKDVELRTYFFNTSVQGNTENKDTQQKINTTNFNRLLENYSHFDQIKPQLLDASHTSYQLAEDLLIKLLDEETFAVSLGCLSAKDRTGFVAERLMIRSLPPEDQKRYTTQLFNSDAPPTKIVADNTPFYRALKVDFRSSWPGYRTIDKIIPVIKSLFTYLSS